MKSLMMIAILFASLYGLQACGKETGMPPEQTPGTTHTPGNNSEENGEPYNISITVDGRTLTATLENNPVTGDFITLLPMTVNMSDFAGAEKIFNLPRRLQTDGAAAGTDPSVGDLAYYEPWGNIAVYYQDVPYSSSLYRMGSFVGGIGAFQVEGDINNVRIELVK